MIESLMYVTWLCLKTFVDKLCQLTWKLFNIPEGALVLVFAGLTFYSGVLDIAQTASNPHNELWAKILFITIDLGAIIISIGFLYFLITHMPRTTNGKSVVMTQMGLFYKSYMAALWIRFTIILIGTPILKHHFIAPDMAWYFSVCIGILMSDNDNNDGETIPAKLKRKLPNLAMVSP